MAIEEIKMTTRTSSGTLNRVSATLEYADGRIYFLKSPYSVRFYELATLSSMKRCVRLTSVLP